MRSRACVDARATFRRCEGIESRPQVHSGGQQGGQVIRGLNCARFRIKLDRHVHHVTRFQAGCVSVCRTQRNGAPPEANRNGAAIAVFADPHSDGLLSGCAKGLERLVRHGQSCRHETGSLEHRRGECRSHSVALSRSARQTDGLLLAQRLTVCVQFFLCNTPKGCAYTTVGRAVAVPRTS